MQGISKSEFAKREKVSKARVSQWIKARIISPLPDGSIDPIQGENELRKNRDDFKRFDWENRVQPSKQNHPDSEGPPPPFTGNIGRDSLIMGLVAFYPYFINIMAPIYLKLLTEHCHVAKESAEEVTILFGFKVHWIIKEFLEKDIFNQWLRENQDTSLDELEAMLFRGSAKKTLPPRDLPTMEHPKFILELLKNQKQRKSNA